MAKSLQAYSIKQKKMVDFKGKPSINKNGNRFMAKGEDDKGNKLSAIMSAANAEAAIKAGTATKGDGW